MKNHTNLRFLVTSALSLLVVQNAMALSMSELHTKFASGDYKSVVNELTEEIKSNPGHEEAYALLAEAYEKLQMKEEAAKTWTELKTITHDPERTQLARLGLLRINGPQKPELDEEDKWENDPYEVDIGRIDWKRLEDEVDQVKPAGGQGKLPPVLLESSFFKMYAPTGRAAYAANQLAEKYTEFLLDKYFHVGQEWALRIPIYIFKDSKDYISYNPRFEGSAGVTSSDPRTGVPIFIAMYMLDNEGKLDREALEGTLPHELVHMVVNEWFGGTRVPRWINEGMARRMEQSRNHYKEAAKTGRDAAAGEYYRFRDLFAQKEYPHRGDRVWRFYEQSATMILFLLEQYGPDAAAAFFTALKQGKSHDEATAGALGLPEDIAVDEFERRWVEWARDLYVRYGDKIDEGDIKVAAALDEPLVQAKFGELPTVELAKEWADVRTDSLDSFKDVGGSKRFWKVDGDKLVCSVEPSAIGSLLGVRIDEEPPMAFKCKIRAPEASYDTPTRFGLGMLDHRGDDTGIEVGAVLSDRQEHSLTCVVTDEIALYIDDKCTGRFPSLRADQLNEDIDWPLAFVAYGVLEVSDIHAARFEEFLLVADAKTD
ncbi:MAG: hypothetical protein DHS20C16_00870 [Phycisphaerae bacterium]|nr:MAG: hypothetical protein DHS20C16_00870 [Phycisphaerae bacterium]